MKKKDYLLISTVPFEVADKYANIPRYSFEFEFSTSFNRHISPALPINQETPFFFIFISNRTNFTSFIEF